MMCQLLFTVGLLMTCLRWTSAADIPEGTVYVMVEGTAVLHPDSEHTGNIRTVTWKYGADKAAEWSDGETICYRQYDGRCELNIRTGELTIKHLTLSDSGFYSAEVNDIEVNTVQLQVMSPVPKPLVSTWCDPPKTYCLLTCEGTTSFPQSLQYRWKEENDWSHSVKVLKITKENKEPEFSCELKNPVSSSRSDPVQNPFITGNLLWIIAVVLVILLIVIVAVVLYYKRKHVDQKEADAEKNEEIKLDQQKQSVPPPVSRPEGTVCEEVNGTAVLHPGSAHTGDIMTVKWKHNGSTAAEWYGKKVFFRKQFEGRCELNTRTGELTINHLTLSHSGSYSVDINGQENNTVQLQVMSKKTAAGEAGDEEEPGETTELLSQSGGVQQESRGGGVQQESRGGGDQQKSTDDVNDPPDVSSAVTSSSEGTVYEEVNGTAVLHPASGLTGKMTRIRWTYNDKTVAEWSGGNISFSNQFKGRCELNTRTGELTIKHLTLSDSGSYSVKINDLQINTVQLQVKSPV